MLNELLTSSITGTEISAVTFVFITLLSLGFGSAIAAVHTYRNSYTKSFLLTIVLLPAIVQLIIMMVNGNLGAGVAIMGAFSLVRFRSIPGNARDIGTIFLAMTVGLASGMGYIGYAVLFLLVVETITVLFISLNKTTDNEKELKITIPENMNYTGLFDDLFNTFTRKTKLESVKTTNMGSLYELRYTIALKDDLREKEFIDALRCRNGNLTICCGIKPSGNTQYL